MRKILVLLVLALAVHGHALAQTVVNIPPVVLKTTAPTGACVPGGSDVLNTISGIRYYCNLSGWQQYATGSGLSGGTTNKIPVWTSSTALGSSSITQGSGGDLTFGGPFTNGLTFDVGLGANNPSVIPSKLGAPAFSQLSIDAGYIELHGHNDSPLDNAVLTVGGDRSFISALSVGEPYVNISNPGTIQVTSAKIAGTEYDGGAANNTTPVVGLEIAPGTVDSGSVGYVEGLRIWDHSLGTISNCNLIFGATAIPSVSDCPAGNWAGYDLGTKPWHFGGTVDAPSYISSGTKFTLTTNTCSGTSTVGGATAGQFASGTSGTCTVVITLGGQTATNGWACFENDLTTPADAIHQTASTTTTVTISGTTVSGDTVNFGCVGF